jgi:hypothetical protein
MSRNKNTISIEKMYCIIEKKTYLCIAFRNRDTTKNGTDRGKQAVLNEKLCQQKRLKESKLVW